MHNVQKRADHNATLVGVYTVTAPIPRGTTGASVIAGNLVKRGQIPLKYMPSDAITDLASIREEVAAVSLAPGQVVEKSLFVSPEALRAATASAAAKAIPSGDVGITVSIDSVVNRVAGLIRPGDQVDMLIQPSPGVWQFLYQNVNVLAVGSNISPSGTATAQNAKAVAAADASALVTFAVPADAAPRVIIAAKEGLYLALVPPGSAAAAQPTISQANLIPATVTPS
jgi:Flp pilus assembly protein CpaB